VRLRTAKKKRKKSLWIRGKKKTQSRALRKLRVLTLALEKGEEGCRPEGHEKDKKRRTPMPAGSKTPHPALRGKRGCLVRDGKGGRWRKGRLAWGKLLDQGKKKESGPISLEV